MVLLGSLTTRSAAIAAVITAFIWVIRENTGWLVPLEIFNLSCVLGIPGTVIMLVLVIIFYPGGAHTAAGVYPPYNYLCYAANFIFYFGLWYLVLRQWRRWGESTDQDGK